MLRARDLPRGGVPSARRNKDPAVGHTARVLYAHTLTHNMGALAEAGEAHDICDVEAGLLLNLYKIAQYELAVDKWDNRAEVILN